MANQFTEDQISSLIREIDPLLTDPVIPVSGYALSVIKDGKIAYERQTGLRRIDLEDPSKNLPMERDTRYRIASISKVFTAIAIMQLYDQGKIDIDEDISNYLGFPLRNPYYPDAVITARQMMSHISSIRDGSAYSVPPAVHIKECFLPGGQYYGNAEHFAKPENGKDRGPGKYYLYSNLNFGILGTVIERLSGERFDRYMRTHVLLPMGIYASYNVGDFDQEQIHNVAAIYKRFGDGVWAADKPWCAQMDDYQDEVQPHEIISINNPDLGTADYKEDVSDYKIGTNGTIFSPQGGLRISAHELALTAEMFLNKGVASTGNRILSEKAVAEMEKPVWYYQPELDNRDTTDSTHCYGTGLAIMSTDFGGDHMVKDVDGLTFIGHTGSAYGLISACFFDPENNVGFAYAFNGLGASNDVYLGEYSNRSIWHERMMTAIYNNLFR